MKKLTKRQKRTLAVGAGLTAGVVGVLAYFIFRPRRAHAYKGDEMPTSVSSGVYEPIKPENCIGPDCADLTNPDQIIYPENDPSFDVFKGATATAMRIYQVG